MCCCRSMSTQRIFDPPACRRRPSPRAWTITSGCGQVAAYLLTILLSWASPTMPLRRASVPSTWHGQRRLRHAGHRSDLPGHSLPQPGDFRQALDTSRQVMGLSLANCSMSAWSPGLACGDLPASMAWSLAELGRFAEGSGVREEAMRHGGGGRAPLQPCSVPIGLLAFSRRAKALHQRSTCSNGA